ncbi:hypothetical protein M9H77_30324 [Catharanthus roseus]|uniref:Uncharacterized protein n=1 Tax=Catharanthus roseus TaxID=4058 RepID=A0ACB9ZY84_CATRO|nr:hypothetical protein M9H77_30324 [Catharanthus roseus]
MTQKNNKDLITVKTIVEGVNITLDQTLLAHIASISNKDPAITFGSTSRIILGEAWKYSEANLSEERALTGPFNVIDVDTICEVVSGSTLVSSVPTRRPGKVVVDEEEDDKEETEGSSEDSSTCPIPEEMQIRHT